MKNIKFQNQLITILITFILILGCDGEMEDGKIIDRSDKLTKNLCPVGKGDNYSVQDGKSLEIDFNKGVLSNDEDPAGGAMSASIVIQPQKGTLTFNKDGSFTYKHDGSGAGEDKFVYVASNSTCDNSSEPELSSMAQVIIKITDAANPNVPSGNIYVGGSWSSGGKEYGAYWTDSNNDGKWERTDLPGARIIHDVAVHDGKVYAVGETEWSEQHAAVWIDGVKTILKTPNLNKGWKPNYATGIAFDGDDIYISGTYASSKAGLGTVSSACYWLLNSSNPEGKLVPLDNGSSDGWGIAVRNGNPITVGWYMGGHNIHPAKWYGTKRHKLDSKNDGEAWDIVVDGDDYYITGWTDNGRGATKNFPSVWKNDQKVRKRLTEQVICKDKVHDMNFNEANGTGIARKNGKTYVSGWTNFDMAIYHGAYWTDVEFNKNAGLGKIHEGQSLPNGEEKGCGYGMTYSDIGVLDDGTVVTVGNYGYAAIAYDGIIHLIEEEVYSDATSLFIPE